MPDKKEDIFDDGSSLDNDTASTKPSCEPKKKFKTVGQLTKELDAANAELEAAKKRIAELEAKLAEKEDSPPLE